MRLTKGLTLLLVVAGLAFAQNGRDTQTTVETINSAVNQGRATQTTVEVVPKPPVTAARDTQLTVEVLGNCITPSARITQVAVEIILLSSNTFIAPVPVTGGASTVVAGCTTPVSTTTRVRAQEY